MLDRHRRCDPFDDGDWPGRRLAGGPHRSLRPGRGDVAPPGGWDRLQSGPLFLQAKDGFHLRRTVNALVGNFPKPAPDLGVGGDDIALETGLLELGHQGHVEAAAQLTVEALDLALGAGAIGAAQFDDETAVLGVVEKSGVVTVFS